MRVGNIVSGDHLKIVGLAGAGAVGAGFVQSQVPATTLNPLYRDLLLVAGALVIVTMGGADLRTVGLGIGAAAVASLVASQLGVV